MMGMDDRLDYLSDDGEEDSLLVGRSVFVQLKSVDRSPPASPPPPPPPPPQPQIGSASPEEMPIKSQQKSFEELLDEKVGCQDNQSNNKRTTSKAKFQFLKKGSRDWNRVKPAGKPKVKKPASTTTTVPQDKARAPHKPWGIFQDDSDADSLQEFRLIEQQAALETDSSSNDDDSDRTDFLTLLNDQENQTRANYNVSDDEDDDNSSGDDVEKAHYNQVPTSRLVQQMFKTLEPKPTKPPSPDTDRPSAVMKKSETNQTTVPNELTEKLMKEMAEFKASNEKLQNSLKMLEDDRKQLERERLEMRREQREERQESTSRLERLRNEMRNERSQLKRDRIALEKQKEHIELLRMTNRLEKQDKTLVESLQATITQLRVSERERATKHKETLRLKNNKIATLEEQVAQLEEALKFAENRRLNEWWAKQSSYEAELEELRSKIRDLEAINKEKEKDQEIMETVEEEVVDHNDAPSIQADETLADKEEKIQKEVSPNGETTIMFPNGDIKKTVASEGLEIYYFAKSNTTRTKYDDGMVVLEFPNGQVERTMPDGVLEVFYPNGTVKIKYTDNSEETLFPDGVKVVKDAEGRKSIVKIKH